MGLSDATGGEQFYQVLDELNNVYRLSIGQYNNGQAGTNNQTVINAAGTGAVVLNGSNNSGTGGVVFGSGGASESHGGHCQQHRQRAVQRHVAGRRHHDIHRLHDGEKPGRRGDRRISVGRRNGEARKESFIYKDWHGDSQWYMVKDASNNWALNSALGGLDSFKAYQSTNSGDTYINASNHPGVVRVNYETGAGAQFKIYGGNSSNLYASFHGYNIDQVSGACRRQRPQLPADR